MVLVILHELKHFKFVHLKLHATINILSRKTNFILLNITIKSCTMNVKHVYHKTRLTKFFKNKM